MIRPTPPSGRIYRSITCDLLKRHTVKTEFSRWLPAFSVGLEDVEDLVADLKQALDAVPGKW